MSKKILITGASGYLANALIPCVAARADVVGVARNIDNISGEVLALSVDLTDDAAVLDLVLSQKPDAIIHCAACNPGGNDDMFAVNEFGTANIATAAKQLACRFVSVSSDTVFDGVNAPFSDDAQAAPLPENAYAISKARGEANVHALLPAAIIVRTSLIYGIDQIDRGTAGFSERLKSGAMLKLFGDVIRQPVHDKALSASLCTLALDLTDESGFINIAGDEAMSRYEFGVRMLDYWGIDYTDRLEQSCGFGIAGLPIDLSLSLQRARALGLPTPGVSTVLR